MTAPAPQASASLPPAPSGSDPVEHGRARTPITTRLLDLAASEAASEATSEATGEQALAPLTIGLVSSRALLVDLLTMQTTTPAIAANAGLIDLVPCGREDGLGQLLEPGLDAILFDLYGAEEEDFDALKRLTAIGPDVPTVALLTECAPQGAMLAALRAGAEDCVIFDAVEVAGLIWTVRRAIERRDDRLAQDPDRAPAAAPQDSAAVTLVQETPDAMVILDREGLVKFANQSAAELLGCHTEEMIGQPFAPALTQGGRDGEVHITLADGQQRTADMTMVESEWEGVPARIATLTDVTIRRKLETEIKETKRKGDETKRRSASFFSNVNHDLRTPLTHIIGFSELMKDERFGPLGQTRYKNYAQDIHSSGQMLLDMIEDLLGIAEAETENIQLTDEICDLGQLLDIAMSSQRMQADCLDISMELDCPDRLAGLRGDARRLRQGFFRLIAEALHCLPRGAHLQIVVRREPDGITILAQSGAYVLGGDKYADGLNENSEDPFISTAGSGMARRDGMALTLTRKIIELHGGQVKTTGNTAGAFCVELKFPASRLVT